MQDINQETYYNLVRELEEQERLLCNQLMQLSIRDTRDAREPEDVSCLR